MFRTGWLETTGGPLLVVEKALLPYWGGVSNVGGRLSRIENAFARGLPSDYGRACSVTRWLERIPVGDGDGLILGGEPLPTALWRADGGVPMLVRWIFAPDDVAAGRAMHDFDASVADRKEEVSYAVSLGECILVDSGSDGRLAEKGAVNLGIEAGVYRPTVFDFKYSKEVHFLIVQFSKDDSCVL